MSLPRSKSRSTSLASRRSAATWDRETGQKPIELPGSAAAPAGSDVEKLAPPAADAGEAISSPASQRPAGPNAAAHRLYNPRSPKFWTIMMCNFLALFLVALDRTILATAIPRITDEFHSLGDVGWYASAYMLTTSASQLLFGRIYKFYPTKWTFLICIVVFEIGSAICGAAPNSTVFIVGRAIAGLASAGIFTGCMLIFMIVPLHRRPMFQGGFGLVFGIASVMGPLIGGAFTGAVTWRWCFYMNLPIGALSVLLMFLWWHPPEPQVEPAPLKTHIERLDPLGTLCFLPAVVALLLALQWGGSTYAWGSAVIIALFVVFGVLFLAFGAVQVLRPETATIPPKVIMQRSVLFGTVFTFFVAGSMLMCIYFLPIWFQTAQGVDPLRSGVYTLPFVLSLVVSSMLSGLVTQRIGYYVPSMILSPSIMAVGVGLLSTMHPSTDSAHWIAYQFLAGFGLGLGMQTGGLAVQTVLPPADVSTGVSITFFAQQLGGAIFTSVGQAILSNVLVAQLSGLPGLHPGAIVTTGVTDLLRARPAKDAGVIVDAYNFACTRIFLASMGLTFGALIAAFFMEWRSVKKPRGPPGGAPGPARPVSDGAGASRGASRIASQESLTNQQEKGDESAREIISRQRERLGTEGSAPTLVAAKSQGDVPSLSDGNPSMDNAAKTAADDDILFGGWSLTADEPTSSTTLEDGVTSSPAVGDAVSRDQQETMGGRAMAEPGT